MKLFGKPLGLVILDFDGVVLDLMASYWMLLRTTAEKLGLSTEPVEVYERKYRSGLARDSNPRFTTLVRELWPELVEEEALRYYWAFRTEEERVGYPPIPGSIETVLWLLRRQARVAICTMNDRRAIAWKLRCAGVDPTWPITVCTREDAGYEKPDPRILGPIFLETGVLRGSAVYVGDWYADIEVARGAGVEFIAVLSGGVPRHAFIREGVPDDHIIGSLADLPKLVEP